MVDPESKKLWEELKLAEMDNLMKDALRDMDKEALRRIAGDSPSPEKRDTPPGERPCFSDNPCCRIMRSFGPLIWIFMGLNRHVFHNNFCPNCGRRLGGGGEQ